MALPGLPHRKLLLATDDTFLEPSLSPTQRMLQMTTKVPVCADVWILSFFCAVQSYVATENWYFVPAVYRTFRETGPAEVLDYVLKVLRTYHR